MMRIHTKTGLLTLWALVLLHAVCGGAEPIAVFTDAETKIATLEKQVDVLSQRVAAIEHQPVTETRVSQVAGDTFDARFATAIGLGGRVVVDQAGQITDTLVVPPSVTLAFEGGAIDVAGKLSIQGPIVAPYRQIFRVDLPAAKGAEQLDFFAEGTPGKINEHVFEIPAIWFDSPTDDWGERINKAIRFGGNNATVRLGPMHGDYYGGQRHMLKTTVDFNQHRWYAHQSLRGASHIGSTMTMPARSAMVGIDCGDSREVLIDGVRINEAGGRRTSAAFVTGGTTLVVRNSWFGNTKYGIVANKGAGSSFYDVVVERCDYGIYVSGVLFDDTITGFPSPSSARFHGFNGCNVYKCFLANVTVEKQNQGWRVYGLHFTDCLINEMENDNPGLRITGDVIVSFSTCTLSICRSEIDPASTVQWVASAVYDDQTPFGRTTLQAGE